MVWREERPQLTDEQATAALQEVTNQLRQQAQEKMQVTAEANKREGAAFLAANKTKEGVITLPSGLQYKVLKQGTGPKPSLDRYGGLQLSWHAHQRNRV